MDFQKAEEGRGEAMTIFLAASRMEKGDENPQRYLRCWECDYPYLRNTEPYQARWLPVPENSAAQRLISQKVPPGPFK
jgi:hypothetical protein